MADTARNQFDQPIRGVSLWLDAWRRLRRNRMAVVGLVLVVLYIIIAALAPVLPIYSFKQQVLDHQYLPPSLTKNAGQLLYERQQRLLLTAAQVKTADELSDADRQQLADLRLYLANQTATYDEVEFKVNERRYLLGTDSLGRDILARIIYGSQVSIAIGIVGTLTAVLIGVLVGALSGFIGGTFDYLVMRFVDVMYGLPYMLIVIIFVAIFGRNILNLFVSLALVSWLTTSRVVRGQIISLKHAEFVQAARVVGAGTGRIIFRHLIPNTLGVVVVFTTLQIPSFIMLESFLSYLGLGVQAPMSSWGSLVRDGVDGMDNYPWMLFFPALTMTIFLFSMNFLGDGLRDALDPQSKNRLVGGTVMANGTILEVRNLKTYFSTDDGIVKAVDDVSFTLAKGETLGIVGESGCGKSVTSLSVMRLIPSPPGRIMAGDILLDGTSVLAMNDRELRKLRGGRISMIFQDPMTCLNPFLRISTQLVETLELHQGLGRAEARAKAVEMLRMVGIPNPERRVDAYPHQFSGGMRQRVMIAMALSCNPEVLIADEPTTALDVTIQAQILEIIKELSRKLGTAVILITHDLGVVSGMCDRINVMYAGRVVERGPTDVIFADPKHPYTRGLIRSVPRLDRGTGERLYSIQGTPPSLINMPECCPFHPRCEHAMDACRTRYPPETDFGDGHRAHCWLYPASTKGAARG